ncbi:hypothetical protein CISG_01263 [Coccidioides immitis RMSCC 3703]|uniref:Uncharacterized protein n=1 Tax=Coccidioides immitis RMSCC 3703 TaxID=454286 RepID=A0A0J8QWX1_COCIT|nr:hypothetical protein CISG_01263 [Coccidioides immitis RMSCC 3703]
MTLRSAIIVSPQPSSAASKPSATSDTRSKPWLGPAPRVETKGLYVFLWDTGAKGKFHWGLFIARSESSGVHFHQVLDDSRWLLVKAKEDVVTSEGLLAALKVGELEDTNDEWIKAVEYCVAQPESMSVPWGLRLSLWSWRNHELANAGLSGWIPTGTKSVISKSRRRGWRLMQSLWICKLCLKAR